MKISTFLLLASIILAGCSVATTQPVSVMPTDPTTTAPTAAALPNPASVYCQDQGGQSEIRTNTDGSQTGYCLFADGSECDEWAFFRGECSPTSQVPDQLDPQPTDPPNPGADRGAAFCEMLGYSLANVTAPDGTQLQVCRFPDGSSCNPTAILKGLCAPASQLGSMPNAAAIYCQGQGYTSEIRTAADGSQNGVCIFTDGRECDEWAYYRGECDPNTALSPSSAAASADPASPTPIPTAVPIDPNTYQGFWTYTHPDYGFSIMLPEDWIVNETSTSDPAINDHVLILQPKDTSGVTHSIRMSFRSVGDESPLWPTGVGQGEFVQGGTLDVAGAPVQRVYLVCPGGQIQSIYYHGGENQPNIQRGNQEFGFIYSYNGAYCEGSNSLSGKVQLVGEMIIASLIVP